MYGVHGRLLTIFSLFISQLVWEKRMPDEYAKSEKGCVTDNGLYHPGFNNEIHKHIIN